MEEHPLYQQIVNAIRQDIFSGRLKPGDRLPSIREMTLQWNCTPGTIQHAYHELADQGLVVSRPGQGTHVLQGPQGADETPLRRAKLVHRAQSFLLEVLTAGYTPSEVETAMRLALDQWRIFSTESQPHIEGKLRFSGSHDLALAWIAAHFPEIAPGFTLEINFSGSLGGLIALAEDKADLAGIHLWDRETNSYNLPFVHRVLPGVKVALLTLAWRQQGLITPQGNPAGLYRLNDLLRPGLRFVNRQPGSGTRVWLDATLHGNGIPTENIHGYEDVRQTHSEVAREVAEGNADVGFGLQTAAQAFGLGFVPIMRERYDLVIPDSCFQSPEVAHLIDWLKTSAARAAITELGGYDTVETGKLVWIDEI